MKTAILTLFSLLALVAAAYGLGLMPQHVTDYTSLHAMPQHSEFQAGMQEGPVTFSIAQNDFDLCTEDFYVGFYEVTKQTYAVGIENVTVQALQENSFAYIRSREELSAQEQKGWIEHINDIPGQLVQIIREDPAVLDNCANFSVALVGPP